eukprot:2602837-Alexandrium_andersonii.AAC.1
MGPQVGTLNQGPAGLLRGPEAQVGLVGRAAPRGPALDPSDAGDSRKDLGHTLRREVQGRAADPEHGGGEGCHVLGDAAVSYTHLTLPTICSV